jgi:hypothetical protein
MDDGLGRQAELASSALAWMPGGCRMLVFFTEEYTALS